MPKEEANCLIRAGQLHPSLSTDFTEVDLLSQENLYIYYPFLVFSFIILVPYGIYENDNYNWFRDISLSPKHQVPYKSLLQLLQTYNNAFQR